MNQRKPVVLIGPISDDPAESVSAVNRALASGLTDRYTFVYCHANRRHGGTRQSRINGWNLYYLFKHAVIWCWNLVRHRPDIAHYAISSGPALKKGLVFLWLARQMGARTVGHLHSGSFLTFWDRLSPERRNSALRAFTQLNAFVVLSESWRTSVTTHIGVPPGKVFVVNNPIDAAFEAKALALPFERPGTLVILSLGVLGRDKGVLDLIAACALIRSRVPHFTLELAGPEREPGIAELVKQRAKEGGLGEQVRLVGSVWGAKKLALFAEASVFILPSYYENFPLVLLEAAAAGQAIISTPVGAVPEFFVDTESALFVEIGNVQQLATAIERVLIDQAERHRLARNGREVFCRKLARAEILNSLDQVYRCAVAD